MSALPENHPQRFVLSNEVHARPPEPITAPMRVSIIAQKLEGPYTDEDRLKVVELTERYGAVPPGRNAKHYSIDLGDFRLVWERHTEFIRYTFLSAADHSPFSEPAIAAVPEDWLQALPGELIAAAHAEVLPEAAVTLEAEALSKAYFSGHALIGSDIADNRATAMTDFRIHKDGFSRFLVIDRGMNPWVAGRVVQRLLEIETYRIVALLGLPVAQTVVPALTAWERDLASITSQMTDPGDVDETGLLERLTDLQAAIEKSYTESQFRFSASAAYHALIDRRIEELREERRTDMQTLGEFTERRLAPAMATCTSAERRQAALSERVDRAAQLLSTRVDLSLERQNAEVLDSMNKRVELQLRLQQTVEGLSIAAITYYIVGVIGYMAKGVAASGQAVNADLVMGVAAPLVAILTAYGVWRARREITKAQALRDQAGKTIPPTV
ncbi:MAG: DUF3422 domain-containing protein [Pseudomonadota bacterium]